MEKPTRVVLNISIETRMDAVKLKEFMRMLAKSTALTSGGVLSNKDLIEFFNIEDRPIYLTSYTKIREHKTFNEWVINLDS